MRTLRIGLFALAVSVWAVVAGCFAVFSGGYIFAGEWREGTVVAIRDDVMLCFDDPCARENGPEADVEYLNDEGRTETITVDGSYAIGDKVEVRSSPISDSALPTRFDAAPGLVLGLLMLGVALRAAPEIYWEMAPPKR